MVTIFSPRTAQSCGDIMTAGEFADEQLAVIRQTFFAKMTDKKFFQERNLLLQAVTYPAEWLNRRGARLPASKYRAILKTVIDTIKEHGDRARIRRVSAYLLHSVQTHMQHHGEDYLIAAKQPRSAGAVVHGVLRKLGAGEPDGDVVEVLIEVRRALRSKGGRKKAAPAAQPTLF
jgi:hypothetical protein